MTSLLADLRHAVRLYAATPLSSAIAVVVLAAAMAVVTAFVSLWSDLALESHPGFEQSGRLAAIGLTEDGRQYSGISLAFIEAAATEVGALEALAGSMIVEQSVERDGEREQVLSELVTAAYFPGMRPRLELGRAFEAGDHEPGAAPVAVLAHDYWQQQFGADTDVLGERISVYGPNFVIRSQDGETNPSERAQSYRIVGVMASSQTGSFVPDVKVWMPFEQAVDTFVGSVGLSYETMTMLRGIARLAPGASDTSLTAELRGRFADPDPELGLPSERRLDAIAAMTPNPARHDEARRQARLFAAGSLLLALVAACNVSLFLLSRAPGRRRELGIRLAVGAPLKRLARQLASEAALLVVAATAAGFVASLWLTVLMRELPFLEGGFWRDASPLDWRVLGVVAGIAVLITLLVSLAPIAGLGRLGIAASSRSKTAQVGPAQRLTATAQIAVAGVLGAAALAFGAHVWMLTSADRGFDAAGVHAVSVQPDGSGMDFSNDGETAIVERERRRELIEAVPGIERVAFGASVPGRDSQNFTLRIPRPDATSAGPADTIAVPLQSADHAYTALLGLRVVHGRALELTDRDEVLVNATLAHELWGRTDVTGEVVGFGAEGWPVVGVVGDAVYGHPTDEPGPRVLRTTTPASSMDQILIESALSPAEVRSELERLVDAGELDVTPVSVDRIEDLWNAQLAADRARMQLTAGAAVLVVVLAAFGFYGTQRYLVSAGRREFAIRAALGAGPRALARLVLRRGLELALPGCVLGVLLGFIAAAWLRGAFVADAVSPWLVAGAVALGIAAFVAAASLGPAHRARRMRAGLVLRED